jgi:hypothetical protein
MSSDDRAPSRLLDPNTWIYVAWFRDLALPPENEDYEWVAVLAILAGAPEEAQAWGDHLARKRAANHPGDEFRWSEVHRPTDPRYEGTTDWSRTPFVVAGTEASEEAIGW